MASTVGAGYDASAAASAAFDFKLYRYTPSLPAAVVFAVFFAVLAALHTWRLLRHRAYYFTTFTVGGYCKKTFDLFHIYHTFILEQNIVANLKASQSSSSGIVDASGRISTPSASEAS